MRREIDGLTALRGVAACWVVAYHMHQRDAVGGALGTLMRHGYLAVDVFFVLSGFVMALSYGTGFAGWRGFGVFLMRRFARVYPLYFVTTLMALGLLLWLPHPALPWVWLPRMVVDNFLLVDAWGVGQALNGPSWSISTELFAYLLFPLLVAMALGGTGGRGLAASLGAVLLGLAGVWLLAALVPVPVGQTMNGPMDIWWPRSVWPLIRCLLEFTVGLATFGLFRAAAVARWFSQGWVGGGLVAGVLVLAMLPGSDVAVVMLVPALLLALAAGRRPVPGLLVLLGQLSYGIYLLHGLVVQFRPQLADGFAAGLGPRAGDAAAVGTLYALILGSAWLMYRFIELPARVTIRGWEGRMFPAAPGRGKAARN